jgi:hypothetical protein
MPPHLFRPDPDLPPHPADLNPHRTCRCGLPESSPSHTLPPPTADAASLAAGEKED